MTRSILTLAALSSTLLIGGCYREAWCAGTCTSHTFLDGGEPWGADPDQLDMIFVIAQDPESPRFVVSNGALTQVTNSRFEVTAWHVRCPRTTVAWDPYDEPLLCGRWRYQIDVDPSLLPPLGDFALGWAPIPSILPGDESPINFLSWQSVESAPAWSRQPTLPDYYFEDLARWNYENPGELNMTETSTGPFTRLRYAICHPPEFGVHPYGSRGCEDALTSLDPSEIPPRPW